MPHTVLVAAVFVPYMLLMTGLGTYIWHTGRYEEGDRDGDDAEMAAAA
jgi:hypothetical protein